MSKRVHHARRQVRGSGGKFVKARRPVTALEAAETMKALYAWRDERRVYAQQVKAANREERWGALRSIALLSLMSTVLVGMLLAGTGMFQ